MCPILVETDCGREVKDNRNLRKMTATVTNLALDVYKRSRHIRAHGVVARPRMGNHGFVAGCVFSKDVLKAVLAEAKKKCSVGRPRDYVDDVTLQMDAAGPAACAIHAGDT